MTFGRFARVVALVLVLVALWLARTPPAPDRIVVVALPGVSPEQAFVAIGKGTASGSPLLSGAFRIDPARPGAAVWRDLFGQDGGSRSPAPLWAGETGSSLRVVAAPERVFGEPDGDATAVGFLGSSSGAVVGGDDLASGRLPAPWDRAVDAVSSEAAAMRVGQWSPWIPVASTPGTPATGDAIAEFQFVRFSDADYYLSPAYVTLPTGALLPAPFLRGMDATLKPLLAEHAVARSSRVFEQAGELFEKGSRGGACVAFDTVAEEASGVFAPDVVASGASENVAAALASRVRWAVAVAGADGRVLLLGGPGTSRSSSSSGWYALLAGDGARGGSDEKADLSFDGARGVLRFLLGVPLTESERAALPALFAKQLRGAPSAAQADGEPPPVQNPWTPAALESAGGAARR